MKLAHQSRTILVTTAILFAKLFIPGGPEFLAKHPEAIAVGDWFIACVLRRFTKEPMVFKPSNTIVLLLLVALCACSSIPQPLSPDVSYKRQLSFDVDGKSYVGAAVLPQKDVYDFTVRPDGDSSMVIIRSCHQTSEGKPPTGFFGFTKPYTFRYKRVRGIESGRFCPLYIDVYDQSNELHSWGTVVFEDDKTSLLFSVDCNGKTSQANGVGICQSKSSLIQRVRAQGPIQFAATQPDSCPKPSRTEEGSYLIALGLGECVYSFRNEKDERGTLLTFGYENVLIRKLKE